MIVKEKAVHNLKEHLFSIFPINNQPGRLADTCFNIRVTVMLHHWFWSFTDVPADVPAAGPNYFCCDICSSLRWQVGVLLMYQLLYHLLDLIFFVLTLVLH
jgi:hypothetical protein